MHFRYLWEYIYALIEATRAKIIHIYREGNMAADYLTKMGAIGNSFIIQEGDNVPLGLRGILRTNPWSPLNIRQKLFIPLYIPRYSSTISEDFT